MDSILFGRNLRRLRHEAQLTLEQLAEAAELSPGHVGHIERGSRTLSVDTLLALCRALHVTPNDLLPEFQDAQAAPVRLEWNARQRSAALDCLRSLADFVRNAK